MKKKTLIYSVIMTVVALGLIGLSQVSAHGMWGFGGAKMDPAQIVEQQTTMFSEQAELLGISVDKMKEYWSQGKDFKTIASELGISEEDLQTKMQQARQDNMKTELQILVTNGVITQEQADARLKFMTSNNNSDKKGMMGGGRHGMGIGRGFGF